MTAQPFPDRDATARSKARRRRSHRLAHLVLTFGLDLSSAIIRLQLVLQPDVQISPIPVVGPARQHTPDALSRLDRQRVLEVENRLLPVRVFCVWTRAEPDRLVAPAELDVEPGDDGVDVVGAAHGQVEGEREGEIGDGHGVEVEGDDGGRVGHDGFDLDCVDEGFGQGGVLERAVVEAPDVVPDCV